jgi:hypothetical protein
MSKLAKALTAAAGNAGEALYVEDVFSTYLYDGTGNSSYNSGDGSNQNIVSGIDLSGEGGMVWTKSRNIDSRHSVVDTARGATKMLSASETGAEVTTTDSTISFNSNGHTVGVDNGFQRVNFKGTVPYNYASWSFRKAEKFFDVVTYTGDGSVQNIAHNLGSVPACIIVKKTSNTGDWYVYHIDLGVGINGRKTLKLNSTAAQSDSGGFSDHPTDTEFSVNYAANTSGATYVAYLFASDAGGFGDDENIIKCGSYTGNGATGQEINLGFEAQWVLVKSSTNANSWYIVDLMRGMSYGGYNPLSPNSSAAEIDSGLNRITPTATGFSLNGDWSGNENGWGYIYIAIRRPMKTPESGTEVYTAVSASTSPYPTTVTSGFPVDMVIMGDQPTTWGYNWSVSDRLRGGSNVLFTSSTAAENTGSNTTLDSNTGLTNGWVSGGTTGLFQMFKRATGFMDVVAYTGDGGTTQTLNHNLGVTPEFMIAKRRNDTQNWVVYHSLVGAGKYYNLNTTSGASTLSTVWGGVEPTSTQFTVGNSTTVNFNGDTYISYHFATLAGVSKVGSYTGTGSNVDVDCGFSAGARFILIKRTDSTGDWYVYDSERGIVAGNDPYLLLNTTAAEVTSTDYIDPLSSGFTVTSSAPAGLNASGGTYIFLAIA